MFKFFRKKIGIIGYGNMGSAIGQRIKNKYYVFVFDKDKNKMNKLQGMEIVDNVKGLVNKTDVVIIAVKPQDFDGLLRECKTYLEKQLIISIAAGITTAYIQRFLGNARVIRAMPNMGAKIGKSVTCICNGALAKDEDIAFALEVFRQLGEVQVLPEEMMNAATAISGSGPGYYFNAVALRENDFIENRKKFQDDFIVELRYAAENVGFDSKTALFLAHWTVVYSDLLLEETKLSAEELRRQVTSKGGTTEAALEVLHNGGSLVDAVKAAIKRAQELSK